MSRTDENSAREEAIRWFARMQDDRRTTADEGELDRWLADDPAHEREYARLRGIWKELDEAGSSSRVQRMRVEALNESRVTAVARLAGVPGWYRRHRKLAVAAALVLAVVLLRITYPYVPIDRSYETAVGERRTVALPDGSEITLNTNTLVHVRYGLRVREIDLEQGQALFSVAHSRWRPFLVDAGSRVIRAVGTEFDVYRNDGEVRVALIEGKISITADTAAATPQDRSGRAEPESRRPASPGNPSHESEELLLTAGRAVSFTATGSVESQPERLDETTIAWRQGKLVFNDRPLEEAVSEVNRYSTRKIVVLDGELATLRVTGVFSTERVDSFLEAVQSSLPVIVRHASDDTFVLMPDRARATNVSPPD